MPEGFRLSLLRNNVDLLIDKLDQPNEDLLVTFHNEFDPYPRKLKLQFSPRSEAARHRIDQIKIKNNWVQYIFNAKLDQQHLRFNTDNPDDMPAGDYSVRLWIEDLSIEPKEMPLKIKKKGGELIVNVPVDARKIDIRPSFANNADQDISDLLDRSVNLDQLPLKQWLLDPRPRPQRVACLLNILAVLRTSPSSDSPFITLINRIIAVLPDRIYAEVDPQLKARLQNLVNTTNFYEDWVVLPEHKNVILFAGKNPDDYNLSSFRQAGHPSMQFSISNRKLGNEPFHYADIDLDLGNPLQDAVGFLVHVSELFSDAKTDHISLQHDLNVPPTDHFLYYDVG